MAQGVYPQIQAILDKTAELGIPKVQDLTTADARALVEKLAAARRVAHPPPEMAECYDASSGAGYGHVPVRIYRTKSSDAEPVIVFYHGGGHVFGSLDSHDSAARYLATVTGCTLIAVDYRMGPERPFPAAVEDCYDATRWVADHAPDLRIDPDRLAVCGDSAGGNLATVVALMARDAASFAISAQALIYPVVDYRGGSASYDKFGQGYGILETDTVNWFKARYLPDAAMQTDWRASPLLAPSLAGLPPGLVLTAECDVLHDEGVAYAKALTAAGSPAKHVEFPGMIHGFFGYLGLVDDTEKAHRTVADFLHQCWTR